MDPVIPRPPASRAARAAGPALALAALALLSGCNFFRPSRPELPTGNPLIPSYTAPETTLVTLALAIQDKSGSNGQSAYIGGFASPVADGQGFTADFDPATVARFPGQSTAWDVGREEIFYANLSRLLPSAAFVFTWGDFLGAPDDRPNANPAVFYRSYLLLATPDEGSTYVNVARGNAELHFVKFGSRWKLVRWIDSEDPAANINNGELCFGQLRLAGP